MREFDSIGDFVRYLETLQAKVEIAAQQGVAEGGKMIQEEAKKSIGHYQGAAGPFAAWAPLSEATLNGWDNARGHHYPGKIDLGFSPPDNPLLRTHELEHHIELSIGRHKAVIGVPDEMVGSGTTEDPSRNVGDVAVWQEFGTRYMPARSFLGRAGYVRGKDAAHAIGHAVYLALAGKVHVTASVHSSP